MKKGRFIGKILAIGAILTLLCGTVGAQPALSVDTSFYNKYPYIRFVSEGDATKMSDDEFYAVAARVGFAVNQTEPPIGDQFLTELKSSVLPRINADSLELAYMVVRGAASPDGPYENNKRLGEKRAGWLFDFIRQQLRFPVNESKFCLDSEAEDYRSLCLLMQRAGDQDHVFVKQLCDTYLPKGNIAQLKTALQQAQSGLLWKRLNKTYFHHLRTARVVLYFKKYEGEKLEIGKIEQAPVIETPPPVAPAIEPVVEMPTIEVETPVVETMPVAEPPVAQEWLARREVLALKTNLLFYGVYMPGYNRWCPIPNVAVEYFPKKGHMTFGASFDMPWWQDYDAHKYFQLRNYQVEARYYLKTHEANRANEPYKADGAYGPLFSGFYLQAYANGGVFGICFDADRGWVGEGFGVGVGAGYVMPLSRNGHWRLELGLQAGYFRCKYDPYQYENPVDPSYKDNLYYYKWKSDPDLFKKRQYRWNWIGPTRVGVTLSYDLLYRRIHKKGVSFKGYETYGAYGTNGAYKANETNEANGTNRAPERRDHE